MIFLTATCILLVANLGSTNGFNSNTNRFSYDSQSNWTGVCVDGNSVHQSPINIITTRVQEDSNLINLRMTGWNTTINGTFSNSNASVLFTLEEGENVTTINHIGTYKLLQFHVHWGKTSGEGSEHRVDGEQAELEIHFVHRLQNPLDSERMEYTVVAVFGDVDEDESLTAPWTQLDPTPIMESGSDSVRLTGFVLDQLLPDLDDLNYWHYEGSLTTPPCNETVAWFILRRKITVPGMFLEQLRAVETSPGKPLRFNFRMVQDVGSRSISTQSSSGTIPSSQAIPVVMLVISALQLIRS